MITNKQQTSRRQWLIKTGRWGLFAFMVGLSVHLLGRRKVDQDSCIDPTAQLGCRDCDELNSCGLPRALSVKHYFKQQDEKTKS